MYPLVLYNERMNVLKEGEKEKRKRIKKMRKRKGGNI
jgi:hypothetical protein